MRRCPPSEHQLVSGMARLARQELLVYAQTDPPRHIGPLYEAVSTMAYANNWLLSYLCCIPDTWFLKAMANMGGPERIDILLLVASLDEDGNGVVSEDELAWFTAKSKEQLGQFMTLLPSMAVVSTLVLGLTHAQSIGRPKPWTVAAASEEALGELPSFTLLVVSYSLNLLCELIAVRAPPTRRAIRSRRLPLGLRLPLGHRLSSFDFGPPPGPLASPWP